MKSALTARDLPGSFLHRYAPPQALLGYVIIGHLESTGDDTQGLAIGVSVMTGGTL